MSRVRLSLVLFLGSALLGCRPPEVTRIVDGRIERGPFISEGAYALYARGAVAEATGDLEGALRTYRWAAGYDGSSPDAWVRIGAIECARYDPRAQNGARQQADQGADAFARAEAIRADFGPLYRERARCEIARGEASSALVDAARALALDPDELETGLVYADALRLGPTPADAVWALRSLAIRHPGSVLPWRALEALATTRGDHALQREALERIEALEDRLGEPRSARFTRVDKALQDGRLDEAQRFAAKARLGSADVAVRAAALGVAGLAIEQAEIVLASDPSDSSARIALAAAADLRGDMKLLTSALRSIPKASTPPSALARWLFADVLRRRVSREAAAGWLGRRIQDRAREHTSPIRAPPQIGPPPADPLEDTTERRVRRALGSLLD